MGVMKMLYSNSDDCQTMHNRNSKSNSMCKNNSYNNLHRRNISANDNDVLTTKIKTDDNNDNSTININRISDEQE